MQPDDTDDILPPIRRRLLLKFTAASAAATALPGCLGRDGEAQATQPGFSIGTNLSGMEWPQPGIRRGNSTLPNLHFTVPRRADIAWLAAQGFRRNRLPVLWELLQPVLFDSRPDAAARALVGEPGAFHPLYAQLITDVLDAHAAVGATCLLDLHNYGRYRDFRYRDDGSVPGLRRGLTPLHRAFTEDPQGLRERIFSLAPGATLTQAHFADVWRRAAQRWQGHKGLAGFGLMNEPHDLPRPGGTEASEGGGEDLAIWPAYARAAIEAIRQVDGGTPIYVGGNEWSSAMSMAGRNPGFPLAGERLVYEVHLYLDAASNGHAFDYDSERRKGFSAGLGGRAIDADTGAKRLAMAGDWAREHRLRLALTEIGMPVDDPRWQPMFERTLARAARDGVEVYSWMGGNHWPIRNYPIHHVPGWYQDRTLVPAVAGPMQQAAGIAAATLYDEGPGWAEGGRAVEITLQARGWLREPLTVGVRASSGKLSADRITLPAGANTAARYRFTPQPGRIATLGYVAEGIAVPPPRKVYALADPVAHAGRDLAEAAHAILARYGASKWEMAHAWTDYVGGAPAQDGQPVRAVADSGFGSSTASAMEMLCFINTDNPDAGAIRPPLLRVVEGRRAIDTAAPGAWGLWCKQRAPAAGVQPHPRNRVPYDLEGEYFALAAIRLPRANAGGVVFQASRAEARQASELLLEGGVALARWTDAGGRQAVLRAPERLQPGRAVLALTSAPGSQALRIDGRPVAQGSDRFAPAVFDQMLIGWGFVDHYPQESLRGLVFGAIAGRGRPSEAELGVLERYLAALAA
ncbi:cellulase family glycosylhydrolase [Ramlibacter tataouinensis]|uniref:glycoside hydrolase family 5 protein n=1 Tax=Ramlibacter tataouinensis TaxID=94132 RepID=UPI0022F3C573|nr:cellulase family glycosylhydrolase [Ramlibacter tataouinensis]WBY00401.1 cellulase family glycosylhydrolase [Ramlibacter tataouinensis]